MSTNDFRIFQCQPLNFRKVSKKHFKWHRSTSRSIQSRFAPYRLNMKSYLALLSLVAVFMAVYIQTAEADHGHGHGHGHYAKGTACIVKGSYCNCHYCKCEKGHIHCGGYGHHGHGKFN